MRHPARAGLPDAASMAKDAAGQLVLPLYTDIFAAGLPLKPVQLLGTAVRTRARRKISHFLAICPCAAAPCRSPAPR